MIRGIAAATALVAALSGCTRTSPPDSRPTASGSVPAPLTIATTDFPSMWLTEQIGGESVEVLQLSAAELADSDADLLAYIPGLDPAVDAAAESFETAVDLTEDVTKIRSVRDPEAVDPYVWFDPINISTMAQTLSREMITNSPTPFEASGYYGLRTFSLQNEALAIDQQMQEELNPCRIEDLVVEAPVLGYLARAYAFEQLPLIAWQPDDTAVAALYYTIDAEAAVRSAADQAGIKAVPIDVLTEGAPRGDLLQGVVNTAEKIAAHQDCPLVKPQSSDRPR